MKEALAHLRATFGTLPAREFGPLKLKAVRQHMIDAGLSRGVINHRINRIKRVIKWAVSEELVPASLYEAVRTVPGLRFGRSAARETEPVGPVADEAVSAILPHVAPQIATMIELQRLTGMRPGEVVVMRPCDLDRSTPVWTYAPADHKNRWRGHQRIVPLGPKAQQMLSEFLDRKAEAFLFSPAEAEAWRRSHRVDPRNSDRKTKIYPCEVRARAARRVAAQRRTPKRPKGPRYDVDSYRRAISYGIAKANRLLRKANPAAMLIPHWHPHQLRHSYATRIRKAFGVEAAQIGLGHARTDVVEIYAEKNLGLAIEIAEKVG